MFNQCHNPVIVAHKWEKSKMMVDLYVEESKLSTARRKWLSDRWAGDELETNEV